MTRSAEEAEKIFHQALGIEIQGARDAHVERACGADAALHARVAALLRAHEEAGEFLARPLVTAAAAEQSGQMIDRYKLLELLGEGGFGRVWMAEQREPVKRRVALKVIKLGMDTKQVISRFEAERQALALMDHPHIARVLDAGATNTGRPYFVMELVRGVPILEYCDKEKLDTAARLALFASVCHAIQHAHHKGIIHRDIKPSNVLVTLHDGVAVPKVIDFGIAKATSSELTQRTLFTEHRQMIGTPGYMSPEQAEMSGLDIDTRADVYSLGVLLYELLTGTTPFDVKALLSKGFAEMMRAIREDEPHKPSTRVSTLGDAATRTARVRHVDVRKLGHLLRGDLDWIVMKCLEKDRTRRYETASGLAADVKRHLDGEPVLAAPPSRAYRVRKFVRRNRKQVIAGGLVTAALVLGTIGTTWGMLWALEQKNRAELADSATRHQLARAREVKRLITQMLAGVRPAKARGADIQLLKGILDDTAARLSKGEVKDQLVAAELQDLVGRAYVSLGLYEAAGPHLLAATEIHTRWLGEEHGATLHSMQHLADLYAELGRLGEAETLHQKTLQIRQRVLGPEHESTLGSMSALATVHQRQLRFSEAVVLFQRTLEIQKRLMGKEDPRTLATLGNLATATMFLGREAEAERLLLEALEIMKRVLGEDDRDTLATTANLVRLYRTVGRCAEAEPLCSKLLEVSTRVLGPEHSVTFEAMAEVAALLVARGRHADAEPLCSKALGGLERVFGEGDPRACGVRDTLAAVYAAQSRFAEALELYQRAFDIHLATLGEKHPDTLASLVNLAGALDNAGKTLEAERRSLEALELTRNALGAEAPSTLIAMGNLAEVYIGQGRYAEAEPLCLQTVAIQKRVLRAEHPSTLHSMNRLASLYVEQGRHAEAEQLIRETLEGRSRVLGKEHESTLGTMANLAVACLKQGRFTEAERQLRELLKIQRRVLGEEHTSTALSMSNLAVVCYQQVLATSQMSRLGEAESLYLKALEIQKRRLGEDHALTLSTMRGLARVYHVEGRLDDAEALCLKTLEIQERVRGAEHRETRETMSSLAVLLQSQKRYDEAEPFYLKVLEIEKRTLGAEATTTLGAMTNLGGLYNAWGRFDDAREMFEASLPAKRRVLGMQHKWTQTALAGLVQAYLGLARRDDALPLQREWLELRLAAADKPDADAPALNDVAWTLLTHEAPELRDPPRALRLAERGCALEKANGGQNYGYYLDTLALAQHRTGDTAKALETQRRCLALLAAGTPASTVAEIRDRMREYEAALAQKVAPQKLEVEKR